MQELLRLLGRPGIFIIIVGLIVVSTGLALCSEMNFSSFSATKDTGVQTEVIIPDILFSPAAQTGTTTARKLLNMANMAFEESLDTGLEDTVKQADFALAQAMLRCDMSLENVIIEKTELRHNKVGPYNFQRLRLVVGNDPLPFVTSLHESLRVWAEKANISKTDGVTENLWIISVDGVVTHELLLTSVFLKTHVDVEGPSRVLRRRAPGDAARLAIVIDDIGEDMRAAALLAKLPYPVTFAVWPRSTNARKVAEAAHAAGREVIIHQPTEPMKYPEMQPGPGALFTSYTDGAIETLVRDSLARVPYAVGMNNHMGSRFTRDKRAVAAMVRPLKGYGFFVLDSVTHPGSVLSVEAARLGIPTLKRDIFLDAVPGKDNVLRQLRKAEKIALVAGSAVAIGHPLSDTLAVLKEWDSHRDTQVDLVRLADILVAPRP